MHSKFLYFAASIILTCMIIFLVYQVSNDVFARFERSRQQMDEFAVSVSEFDLQMYNNTVVKGDTVIAAVKRYNGIYRITIATPKLNNASLSGPAGSGGADLASSGVMTFPSTDDMVLLGSESGPAFKELYDRNSLYYVNEDASFKAYVNRNENDSVEELQFVQDGTLDELPEDETIDLGGVDDE